MEYLMYQDYLNYCIVYPSYQSYEYGKIVIL